MRVNSLIPIILSLIYVVTCFLECGRWDWSYSPHYRPGFAYCVQHIPQPVRDSYKWAVSIESASYVPVDYYVGFLFNFTVGHVFNEGGGKNR